MMRKRGIFYSKDDILYPVEDVFNDHKIYYEKIMELLVNESILLQTDIQLNDQLSIDDIKTRTANKDINLIQEELLQYENNKIGRVLEIASYYPNNFRSFFLVQIYGFIERELILICDEHAEKQGIVRNENKPLLKSTELYIKFHWSNFDIKLTEQFRFLDFIRLIRNKIVHTSGIIKAIDKARIEKSWKNGKELIEYKEIGEDEFQICIYRDKLIHELLNRGESLFKIVVYNTPNK